MLEKYKYNHYKEIKRIKELKRKKDKNLKYPSKPKFKNLKKKRTLQFKMAKNSIDKQIIKTYRTVVYFISGESGRLTLKQLEWCLKKTSIILRSNKAKTLKNLIKIEVPITKKAIGIRMGKGKSDIDRWIYLSKYGLILFYVIINKQMNFLKLKGMLKQCLYRLPIKIKIHIQKL